MPQMWRKADGEAVERRSRSCGDDRESAVGWRLSPFRCPTLPTRLLPATVEQPLPIPASMDCTAACLAGRLVGGRSRPSWKI